MAMKGVEKGEAARYELEAKRFKEADPNHDGKMTAAEFIYWYTQGRYEGTPQRGARDGEGSERSGPRDGESSAPRGERDGK
jgi:hypothetical protein